VIAELEIGAVGTEFSRRMSQGAREHPRGARIWKSMKNEHLFEMYTNTQMTEMYRNHIFLNETGHILNEKMMLDVTVTVQLVMVKKAYRKRIFQRKNVVEQEASRPCTHKPPNFCDVFKKPLGASPKMEVS
jgi:hypothetical protein